MGGYCGDSYYRSDEDHKRDMFWVKIFVIIMILIIPVLIWISPMFYS